jgi:hypothetical protein
MASTDKFNKVISGTTRPVATTLSAQKLSGATSFTVVAATGWETTTAVHGIMYRTDAQGNKVAGSQIDWKGDVSGTTVSDVIITAGTDDTYAIGTTVELAPTAAWGDDIATGILVEHKQTGGHSDVTADTIAVSGVSSLSDHIDVVDGKSVRDGNNNELITFSQTASAVNELTVKNAATTASPEIQATGGDTNIGMKLAGKGNGILRITGLVPDKQVSSTTYNSNLIFQTGWDYITGTSTSTGTKAITFPVTFDTVLGVTTTSNGYSAGNPASITASTSATAGGVNPYAVTTSGFTAIYYERDAAGTMGTNRFSFSWIAWGIKA